MEYLVGDIGGTNARLARYTADARSDMVELRTASYSRDTDLLGDALAALPGKAFDGCCLAVAGPVFGDRAHLTNGDIAFSCAAVRAAIGVRGVELVNDMVALGAAVGESTADRFERLGGRVGDGVKGVIAAGTGLGMAIVTDGRCLASEGGHARIAPVGAFERELVDMTEREDGGAVAWEHYLSGRGVVALYRAVSTVWGAKPQALNAEQIIDLGVDEADPVCHTTVETWSGMLATAAGGLAVTALTFGGIYLAGSVAVAMAALLREPLFRRRFEDAAWAADFLVDVPIYLIADPYAGLDGAAIIAANTRKRG